MSTKSVGKGMVMCVPYICCPCLGALWEGIQESSDLIDQSRGRFQSILGSRQRLLLEKRTQTPSRGGAATPSRFLPDYCTTSQLQKKVLQLNEHELRAYSVSGTKDLQPSQTSSLPCLSVGVICGCLNLVNYTRTCFLGEGEAPKGRDGVLRQ